MFHKALDKAVLSSPAVPYAGPPKPQMDDDVDAIFLHLPFHPQDVPRKETQQPCWEALHLAMEACTGIQGLVIACSRLPNVGDHARCNRLEPHVDADC